MRLTSARERFGEPGFDVYTGHGRVNFFQAVLAAQDWLCETAPDTTAPSAAITAPTAGAALRGTVTVSVQASDNVGVSRVDLFCDGALVSGDTSPPHEWAFDTTTRSNGAHTLSARAYDAAGNMGQSASVSVTVDNALPTVSFSALSTGATVSGTLSVAVSASDNAGVASVVLSLDGTALGTDTTAPYSFSWNTTAATNGAHTLTATASDAAGNTASASLSVTVSNAAGDTTPPTISITAPVNGARVSGQVNVTVNASDNVGVTRVDLYVDGVLKRTSTSAPFTTRWNSQRGTHTLQCKAYDAAGNVGVSAPVTVYR